MNIDIYPTYDEANNTLNLPRGRGAYNDLVPIPALYKDKHAEQYTCVVHIRKWTYDGNTEPPDLSFLGLECKHHFCDGYKTDIFVYARVDGNDSQR